MNIQKKIEKALEYCRNNNFKQAVIILSNILQRFPNQPNALQILSEIYISENNFEKAEQVFQQLIDMSYLSEKDLVKFANIKLELNKPEDAKEIFQKITHYRDVNYFIGYIKTYRMLDRFYAIEAIEEDICYQNFSQDLNLMLTLGYTFNFFSKYKKALNLYEKNKYIFSNEPKFLYNYAITLNNNRYYDEALNILKSIEKKFGSTVEIKKIIAASYMFKNEYTEAIHELDKCKQMSPDDYDIDIKKTFILLLQKNTKAALDVYNKIINESPHYYQAYLHKGFVKLNKQELKEGWNLYRYRQLVDQKKCVANDFNIHEIDWKKNVHIYQEQGIGDWIFHIRMLSLVKDNHQNIYLHLDKRLHSLIETNFPKINLLSTLSVIGSEVQNINLGSIGRYLISQKEQIRNIESWSTDLNEDEIIFSKKIKIGISWKSQNRDWGDDKSIDLDLFKVFGNKYDLINLQYGDVKNEINEIKIKHEIEVKVNEEIDLFNDILGLSRLICSCDYIVTISNVTAHIAGALGKNTLLMLPKNNGKMWYWSKDNKCQSLWYPSVRIIDYNQIDGWEGSIREAYKFISNVAY